MPLWFAAALGLVQGLTEFLPISSTAHLRIAPELFGQPDPGAAFSAVIQLGTLLAVIVYFARDLFIDVPRAVLGRTGGLPDDPERAAARRLPLFLVVGTIPIAILGLTLKDFITGDARSLYVVASALFGVGVLMYVVDRRGDGARGTSDLRLLDVTLIGLAQACALIPGVSRSGATIVCALVLGMRRDQAARFSFLLGIPAIGGAGVFELRDALAAMGDESWWPILVGTAAAFVSGYLSIAWLLRYLARKSLAPFAVYRIALGLLLAALCIGGVLTPRSTP